MILPLLVGLASALAPRRCALCKASQPPAPREAATSRAESLGARLCGPCARALEPIAAACPACGLGRGRFHAPAPRCAACRSTPKRGLETTVALLRYRGAGRRLLHAVKYAKREDLGAPLGRALGARVIATGPDQGRPAPDLVVPIPLHWWRRWRRGFNQAALVGEGVGEVLAAPVVEALARTKATPALFGIEREAREAVVGGAFAVRAPVRGALQGANVLLVDDIRTSGATLRAAAAALLEAGAARVDAAVVAR